MNNSTNIFNFNSCCNEYSDERLCKMVREGNDEALNELIERNTDTLKSAISKINLEGILTIDEDDLMNEAMLTVRNAAIKFEPGNAKFSTYLYKAVENNSLKFYNQCKKKEERSYFQVVNLDQPFGKDNDGHVSRYADVIPSDFNLEDYVTDRAVDRVRLDRLPEEIASLRLLERYVINAGLNNITDEKICRRLGITRRDLAKIKNSAIRNLRLFYTSDEKAA